MTAEQLIPSSLNIIILLLFGLSIVYQSISAKKSGMPVFASLFLFIFFLVFYNGFQLYLQPSIDTTIYRGWIGPLNKINSITVGIFQDFLSYFGIGIFSLISFALLIFENFERSNAEVSKSYSSIGLAFSGFGLIWVSMTPWTAFFGFFILIVGVFLFLSRKWTDNREEANFAISFLVTTTSALLISILGTSILVKTGNSLNWAGSKDWMIDSEVRLGSFLLAAGILFVTRPFPLMQTLTYPTKTSPILKFHLCQILVAAAALAVLLRMELQLRLTGVFIPFGWICLSFSFLSFLSSLFQKNEERGLALWFSGVTGTAFSALAFSGKWNGLAILMGTVPAVLFFSLLFTRCSPYFDQIPDSETNFKKVTYVKTFLVLCGLCGVGFIGFIGAGGALGWLEMTEGKPLTAVAVSTIFFLLALSFWRLIFRFIGNIKIVFLSWKQLVAQSTLLILSMGVVWTGTLSGGVMRGNVDRVFLSFVETILGSSITVSTEEWVQISAFQWGSWFYWGASVLALSLAFWEFAAKKNHSLIEHPLIKLIRDGYRIDYVFSFFLGWLFFVSRILENFLFDVFWKKLVMDGSKLVVRTMANGIFYSSEKLTQDPIGAFSKGLTVLAKVTQVVQNGRLQWYLLCGLTSAIILYVFVIIK